MYKKEPRPWFATFSREGRIISCKTITEQHTTRRTLKQQSPIQPLRRLAGCARISRFVRCARRLSAHLR